MNMNSFKLYILLVGLIFTVPNEGYKPVVMEFSELEPYLHRQNDTTYVINFWATWCRPCVKELPYFEQVTEKYKEQKVKVILVSLDFAEEIETKLIPFIKRKDLKSKIIVLDRETFNYSKSSRFQVFNRKTKYVSRKTFFNHAN